MTVGFAWTVVAAVLIYLAGGFALIAARRGEPPRRPA
jgi:hypothetical protein